ncbi:MAG: FAD-dependent oxidoreductase [Mesorhizobium sp.]|uniref:NAD(P)/FAD-dependent oxidoreductase n=1 Tax=Mesorhizobium sp. TaxID=1871066 RepID=UPI000FE7BD9E|nr:FAD-binding oxidoreductase [Mesorhizobium sp.]RWG56858.1 MAG: FAD-dependent oxidoreductase [Mesorhizobium sp.]
MQVKRNGDISFWYADLGAVPSPRPPLPGDIEADVAIVGAGYTGLWTAYYLKKAKPSLRIVLLEREFAGFGASGRNGGWLSGGFGWSREKYLKTSTRQAVSAMQAAMAGCVDEVIRVATAEDIDADIRRADNLTVATNAAQLQRVREACETIRSWDADPERIELLDAAATRARINIANVMGSFVIHGQARVQPAKLVRGLAEAVEPLPQELWREIGWDGHELLGNAAHAYCYAQRTREGRITMGGRGVPYRYGSHTDVNGRTQQATIDQLHTILTTLLPQTAGCRIDHAWCGVLGVPRDWCTTVGLDPRTRIGWAGGYVGLGVSSSNLSGRTLADLILGNDTDLTRLPWVNRKVRPWEPEPFRWLGVHSMYQLYRIADQREAAGLNYTSKLAALADSITGH